MLFNSFSFIFIFLPITFIIYFYLNSKKMTEASKSFLALSSLFFYSWWNIIYLPLILISMVFNYMIGMSLAKDEEHKNITKKRLLTFGILFNVGLLGYFKYSDFVISILNNLFSMNWLQPNLELPLAISFFTFQQIAYLVDSNRGETKDYDFINYAMFVTFFPQLIAGPIVHHEEMMPQFHDSKNKNINFENIALGLFIFSLGLFKKVIFADTFSTWASCGFDKAETLSFLEAWITSLSYSLQLYFDFSGYTDMAMGAATLFNIKLPMNFISPYKATSIQDFWRRWHITLSRFLRDYIYIPLGGNRKGNCKTYINLIITFLIGGLWHGAGWMFIFWGFLHGIALVLNRIFNHLGFKLNSLFGWILTFNFVNIAWIFFRASNLENALKVIKGMFGFNGIYLPRILFNKLYFLEAYGIKFGGLLENIGGNKNTLIWVIGGMVLVLFFNNSIEIKENFKRNHITMIMGVMVFLYAIISLNNVSEFLYFNF